MFEALTSLTGGGGLSADGGPAYGQAQGGYVGGNPNYGYTGKKVFNLAPPQSGFTPLNMLIGGMVVFAIVKLVKKK